MEETKRESTIRKFYKYHLPVILYALAIIVVSSMSNMKTPNIRFFAFDKIAHFFEYAIFAVLAYRSISNLSSKFKINTAFYITTLFLILFATFDEYFVQTLSRRNSSPYDLAADLVGAFLVLIILQIFRKKRLKTEENSKSQNL